MNLKKFLKALKLHESTISMILGAIVIVIVGVIVVNYFSRKEGELIPPLEISDEIGLPSQHTVKEGETLWSISENYYGTGYNWVDIARENQIQNPDQVRTGQRLEIPKVEPRLVQASPVPPLASKPTATEIVSSEPSQSTHKVQKGDSLWKIAEKYYNSGYNWVDIAKENQLNQPNIIEEGQELSLPQVEPKLITKVQEVEPNNLKPPISGATYKIEPGDSLWTIAVRAYSDGYKWVEISKENNLSNPNLIHSGNTLSLPR